MRAFFSSQLRAALLLSALLLPVEGRAQTGSPPDEVRAGNAVIAVMVSRATGQFRIEAAGGAPLLFTGEKGVTAYSNLHVFNNTYTTNLLHRPAAPTGTEAFPALVIEERSDRIRLSSVVKKGRDSVAFTQEFIPSVEGDYAYVNVVTSVRNLTMHPLAAGSLLMFDVMIGAADSVDLSAEGARVTHEREWIGAAVPVQYEAAAAGSPYRIRGRLRSATADTPDRFTAGNWQFNGYLGTVAWDYSPSGLPIIDDAVLLRWDDTVIAPGETRTVGTDYGYLTFSDIDLRCGIDPVGYNGDSTDYLPDPVPLRAVVQNTGVLPLSSVDVAIALPPELTLAAGESTVKSASGPVLPGETVTLTWLVHPAVVSVATRVQVRFDLLAPAALARSCSAEGEIPPLRKPSGTLDCGDTIRLVQNPVGAGYAPDPFLASVLITNTGKVPIRGASATILLPPEIVLVAPGMTRAVLPDPLPPGQSTQIDWQLRGIIQNVPTTAEYRVEITSPDGLDLDCRNTVLLPPVNLEPCFEAGVSTAGTEFYFAYLPDVVGAAAEFLRVFIAAPQESHVRIQQLDGGAETVVDVAAGTLRMVELDPGLNDYPPETQVLRGVRVVSDHPIHLFAGNYRDRHSDGTVVLPVHALGTRYVTAGYNWSEAYEHFVVVATEDGTDVTITPHAFTSSGRPDGQPIAVTLGKGELYYVRAFVAGIGGSLTGSRIEATKPVAVFSGAESGWIPEVNDGNYGYLNPHAEQMVPYRFLGTEYIAVPYRSRRNGDTYRIVATEDATTLTLNGIGVRTLSKAGDWLEDNLSNVLHIAADKPVMVAQFANSARWDAEDNEYGDASMLILVPADRFMSCHYFPAGMLEADVTLLSNQAVSLEVGSWLQVDDTPQLASPAFTVECWIRPWDSGTIVSREGSGGEYWRLDFDRGRRRLAVVTGTQPQSQINYSVDNLANPGIWMHVALVLNGSAGRGQLYVNGVKEMDFTTATFSFPVNGGLAFGGVYNDFNAARYSGMIDECRYWTTERTEQEIQAAMNARLTALDRNGLAGYWSFCESYTDETRFSHHFLPMGIPVLRPVADLPAGLNCVEQEDSNFVNIVVPDGGQGQVLLNFVPIDAGAFTRVSGTTWFTARLKVPTGINRLETADVRGLGAATYGFAYHDAYTMSTGFRTSQSTASRTDPPLAEDVALSVPWPQPARDIVAVRFSLPAAAEARLVLVDALGRVCRTLLSGGASAGVHRILLETDGLASGKYQLVLQASGKALTQPVVILR